MGCELTERVLLLFSGVVRGEHASRRSVECSSDGMTMEGSSPSHQSESAGQLQQNWAVGNVGGQGVSGAYEPNEDMDVFFHSIDGNAASYYTAGAARAAIQQGYRNAAHSKFQLSPR